MINIIKTIEVTIENTNLQLIHTMGWGNYTLPNKPQSSKQKYVITEKGRRILETV